MKPLNTTELGANSKAKTKKVMAKIENAKGAKREADTNAYSRATSNLAD